MICKNIVNDIVSGIVIDDFDEDDSMTVEGC